MSRKRGVGRWGAVALVVGMLGVLLVAPAQAAPTPPSLRLIQTQTEQTVNRRSAGAWIRVDPRVWATPVNGTFDVRVARADYDEKYRITQVIAAGRNEVAQERALPGDIVARDGLARFVRVTVRNADGDLVKRTPLRTFCPNSYEPQRAAPEGPDNPRFPYGCWLHHFAFSHVWGIDEGWATRVLDYGGVRFRGPDGRYRVTVSIARRYVDLFQIAPKDARASVAVTVRTRSGSSEGMAVSHVGQSTAAGEGQLPKHPRVRTVKRAPSRNLPDLASLPAWGIRAAHVRGRDLLRFAANVWVGGTSRLDVEGFRRQGEDVMDAYQYFYRGDEVVARARVGTMHFHRKRGHNHWHFTDFARYRLLDDSRTAAVRSHKQSFCIVPTDSIALALPDAEWRPGYDTACGWEDAMWVRQVLPIGWGDTYYQGVAGQAFNITNVPNGTYYVEVTANPGGRLFETDTSNNVTLRKVVLKGRSGARTVCVPPYTADPSRSGC
ncbi:lysyl oxidase family protein [Haloechinothrix salitolerans]|uniref:Lysyl oxidase family protein n=1 Tax=Haloechinothrix salitolerans TaxID=926830 RepID=A0ABW2BZ74_9PSEU